MKVKLCVASCVFAVFCACGASSSSGNVEPILTYNEFNTSFGSIAQAGDQANYAKAQYRHFYDALHDATSIGSFLKSNGYADHLQLEVNDTFKNVLSEGLKKELVSIYGLQQAGFISELSDDSLQCLSLTAQKELEYIRGLKSAQEVSEIRDDSLNWLEGNVHNHLRNIRMVQLPDTIPNDFFKENGRRVIDSLEFGSHIREVLKATALKNIDPNVLAGLYNDLSSQTGKKVMSHVGFLDGTNNGENFTEEEKKFLLLERFGTCFCVIQVARGTYGVPLFGGCISKYLGLLKAMLIGLTQEVGDGGRVFKKGLPYYTLGLFKILIRAIILDNVYAVGDSRRFAGAVGSASLGRNSAVPTVTGGSTSSSSSV